MQILSIKRHDLLNHLQVISGYLQLNKPERAREYLHQIQAELTAESRVCSCKPEALALELLYLQSQALLAGSNLVLKVENSMENSLLPAEALVAIVQEYNLFIKEFGVLGQLGELGSWSLELLKAGQGNLWCFQVPPQQQIAQKLAERLRLVLSQASWEELCPIQLIAGKVYIEIPGR